MMFKAYIDGHSETTTDSPRVARAAYEELLARDDLIGLPAAAVLERDGLPLFISQFNKPLGDGRINPSAPLDVFADNESALKIKFWQPRVC